MTIMTHDYRPDNLETAAHVEREGWHKVGKKLDPNSNTDEWLKAAGLDWTVSKKPVHILTGDDGCGHQTYKTVPHKFCLTRDSDNKPFDIVGSYWNAVQNRQLAEVFEGFVKQGTLTPHAAGATQGGQNVFMVAKINKAFTLFGKDVNRGLICFRSPHRNGASISVSLIGERLSCANQLPLGGLGHSRWSHVAKDGFNVAVAQKILQMSEEKFLAYTAQAQKLSKSRAKPGNLTEFFKRVFHLDAPPADLPQEDAKKVIERNERQLERIMVAHNDQPGIEHGTGTWWHAVNTVTYVIDHVGGRGDTAKRFHSAQWGVGAERKHEAMVLAMKEAA